MDIIQGFQDVLPEEMEKRRFCESRLTDVFKSWGYQEIDTPTLEYYDVLTKGIGPELRERMFKLLNADGEIIVLRPDMTTPIARMTVSKLGRAKNPFYKFYYLNHVFRKVNSHTEDQQEFHQAGIELLGIDNRLADAEVIAVAIQALVNAGLKDFYIDMGSARFFNAMMEKLPLLPEYKKSLGKAIMNKDFVLLEKLLFRYDLSRKDRELVLCLPHWRGDESVITEAEKAFGEKNETATTALQEIREVYHYLKLYGLEKYILIDLGIIRNFDYYTGIIFEGYTHYMGSAICGGGRYDRLCQQFGKEIPSTGIAIGIEKLSKALAQQNNVSREGLELNERKYYIRYQKDLISVAFKLAERLRNQGNVAEIELEAERPKEQVLAYALEKKIRYVLDIRSETLDQINRYDLQTNKEESVSYHDRENE